MNAAGAVKLGMSGGRSMWLRMWRFAGRLRRGSRWTHRAATTRGLDTRNEAMLNYFRCYEEFVEVLCDAARDGPTPRLEERYQELRFTLEQGYPEIKPFALAYVKVTVDDALAGLFWQGMPTDAFEALIAPTTLQGALDSDHGDAISRIQRTRHALTMYADHLRRLAAKQQPCELPL